MNDVIQTALVKLLGKDLAVLTPGKTEINEVITLHVQGTLRRGEDSYYTPTVSIPLKATLALLLSRMGFQREKAGEILVQCMTEALTLTNDTKPKGADILEALMANVDDAMARVNQITGVLPKQLRAGAVTVKGSVEVVPQEQLASV